MINEVKLEVGFFCEMLDSFISLGLRQLFK